MSRETRYTIVIDDPFERDPRRDIVATCKCFTSNIYPGSICSGHGGCGEPWEAHPQAQVKDIISPDGSCLYEQDVLGLPCLYCGGSIETHKYRIPTFHEICHDLDAGIGSTVIEITAVDLESARKFQEAAINEYRSRTESAE